MDINSKHPDGPISEYPPVHKENSTKSIPKKCDNQKGLQKESLMDSMCAGNTRRHNVCLSSSVALHPRARKRRKKIGIVKRTSGKESARVSGRKSRVVNKTRVESHGTSSGVCIEMDEGEGPGRRIGCSSWGSAREARLAEGEQESSRSERVR